MIIAFLSLIILTISLIGYSFFVKYVFLNQEKKTIENYDFILGVLLIGTLSIFLNFFFKLSYFFEGLILIGVLLYLISRFTYKNNIEYLSLFLILFLFTFFTYDNGLTYDSPLYHQQILKWQSDNKITFGLINLESRYAMVSFWHSFLAIFSRNLFTFNPAYLFGLIPFALLCNSSLVKKNALIADNYLFFSIIALLSFSVIHPFKDGIILNHLGSPETDIINIVFFIFTFYFFLKFVETKEVSNLIYIILFSIVAMLSKITYLHLLLLIIYCLIISPNILLLIKSQIVKNYMIYFLILIASVVWLVKSLIVSGCFVFPIYFTCLDVSWGDINLTKYHLLETKSWSRDTDLRMNFGNFKYTLYSFDWLMPWITKYLFKTSILQGLLISFLILFISKIIRKFVQNKKIWIKSNINFFIYLVYFPLSLLLFMQSPEVRYAHGLIISIIAYNLLLSYKSLFNSKILFNNKSKKIFIFSLLILLCLKNFTNFELLFKNHKDQYDYSNIQLIGKINNYEIYKPDYSTNKSVFCFDFKKICVYKNIIEGGKDYYAIPYIEKPVEILKVNSYLFVIKK